jgi:hypothetical protein
MAMSLDGKNQQHKTGEVPMQFLNDEPRVWERPARSTVVGDQQLPKRDTRHITRPGQSPASYGVGVGGVIEFTPPQKSMEMAFGIGGEVAWQTRRNWRQDYLVETEYLVEHSSYPGGGDPRHARTA